MAVLGGVVLAVTLLLRPWLFAICQDEEYARVAGLPVRALNLLLAVTTAVTVTVAMRAVGLLLVSAMMVVPVAAAQLVTRGFRATMHLAMLIGVVAAAAGIGVAAVVRHRARRHDRAGGDRDLRRGGDGHGRPAILAALRPPPRGPRRRRGRAARRRAAELTRAGPAPSPATVNIDEHDRACTEPDRDLRGRR